MLRTPLLLVVLLLSVLFMTGAVAADPAAPECRPQAEEVRGVRAVATGIVTADNARDLDRVLGYYAAHAMLLPPGESPVVGREKIRVRYESLFAGFMPEIEARIEERPSDRQGVRRRSPAEAGTPRD